MFDQQNYVNGYIKNNYKSVKLRIRNDNELVLNYLKNVDNVNSYILNLIKHDVYQNTNHNFINDDVKIDFELSNAMRKLIDKAEEADYLDDYGLYMNMAYAIDSQAKEVSKHLIRESDWENYLGGMRYENELYDFTEMKISPRNLEYGGRAGEKTWTMQKAFHDVNIITDLRKQYCIETIKIHLEKLVGEEYRRIEK